MKRNKKIVSVILVVIIIVTIPMIFFIGKRELLKLESESKYQVSQVEQNVQVTVNFIDYMSTLASEYFADEGDDVNPLYYDLKYNEEKDVFYMDSTDLEQGTFSSTLSGPGQIPVSQEAINELGFVFLLDKFFVEYYENNDSVVWVYYIGKSGIISTYPSEPMYMYEAADVESHMVKEYYTNALPENNPEREPVWTGVYTDLWGKGQVITLSVPIYDGDEFMGIIATDRSIDDIRATLHSKYDTYLYDTQHQSIIVSNTEMDPSADSTNSSSVNINELESILGKSSMSGEGVEYIDGCFVFTHVVENTEWVYASVIPVNELILKSTAKALPIVMGVAAVVFGLFFNSKRKEQKVLETQLTQEVTIEAISALTETRDSETGNHISRTKLYVNTLVESLAENDTYREYLTPEKIRDISVSAPLHDIGKVGISDSILLKPGKLTDAEFETMKMHTQIGADVLFAASKKLGSSSFLDCAIEMSLCHHEKWDGTGYPNGLSGDAIPLSARIMAVSDVYDALRSERVYKKAFPHEKSFEIIVSESGTTFDPDVVEAFIKSSEKFRKISDEYVD